MIFGMDEIGLGMSVPRSPEARDGELLFDDIRFEIAEPPFFALLHFDCIHYSIHVNSEAKRQVVGVGFPPWKSNHPVRVPLIP